jgi:hypothetical protein
MFKIGQKLYLINYLLGKVKPFQKEKLTERKREEYKI